jgi:hypothetical protein
MAFEHVLALERGAPSTLPTLLCLPRDEGKGHSTLQDRHFILNHIEATPDNMWKTTLPFKFRNEGKVYGSPMFDKVWMRSSVTAWQFCAGFFVSGSDESQRG